VIYKSQINKFLLANKESVTWGMAGKGSGTNIK